MCHLCAGLLFNPLKWWRCALVLFNSHRPWREPDLWKQTQTEQQWQSVTLPGEITVSCTTGLLLHRYLPESDAAGLRMISHLSADDMNRVSSMSLLSLLPSAVSMSTILPLFSLLHVTVPSTERGQRRVTDSLFLMISCLIPARDIYTLYILYICTYTGSCFVLKDAFKTTVWSRS